MQPKNRISMPDLTPAQRQLLEGLYELYYEPMLAKAFHILKNRQDAEDAVQEAFYHVCLHVEDFASLDSNSTEAMIHTYTRNVAINHYHRKKRQIALIANGREADRTPDCEGKSLTELIAQEENAVQLRQAVDMLEPMYREVIVLKYYEHKSNTEIAEQLGISRNLVNGRIFRAKKILRELLGSNLL